jgi:hypothetical protein
VGATNLVIPEKDSTEGYEQPIDTVADGLAAGGFFPQYIGTNDLLVGTERDALGNLVLKDTVTGTKTLADLVGSSGVSSYDFLLDCEPDALGTTYVLTRVGGRVSKESWANTATSALIKTIDYTRTGGRVSTEVRKIFDATGLVVVAQLTVTYTRLSGRVSGATYTRDI